MRRKNTRPTVIYWLVDTRTETPFYCGKTIYDAEFRLGNHKRAAVAHPRRPLSVRLVECGKNVRSQVVEIVAPIDDWVERERHWISYLRQINPKCVNVSDGGDGPAGLVHSAATRAKISAAQKGKKQHPNQLAGLRRANTGRTKTSAELDAIGAAHRGKVVSEATREKLRVARLGKTQSAETRAKQSAALSGIKRSAEYCAKLRDRKHTPETREKIRQAALRQHASLASV